MSDTQILATTQYNDYKGNVSFDNNDLQNIFSDLIESKNINRDKYFPVSITFNKSGKYQTINIDTTEVASNYSELKTYLEQNQEPIPITRFRFDMNINDFLEYSKKFSFIITIQKDLIKQNINITDSISL